MSRPIKLTNEEINKYVEEFRLMLTSNELTDDIRFSKNINVSKPAEIIFTPMAYLKIKLLVQDFQKEVQWHGTVERINENTFKIKDIILFPHEITSATVTSSQEEYEKWLDELDDDTFNSMRFHGHSHVNMCCNPSGVDMGYRLNLINTMSPTQLNPFYIFMIFNKKNEFTGEIYDIENNVLYKNSDIKITIELDEEYSNSDVFLSIAHIYATEPKPVATPTNIGFKDEKKEQEKPKTNKWYDTHKEHKEAVYSSMGIVPSEDKNALDEIFID